MDLLIPLDRSLRTPLCDQLYAGLRLAILDGRLARDSRLPATRVLASTLGISRFTIDDAYSRLVADGYLTTKHGSGTFVAYAAPTTSSGSDDARSEADSAPDRGWSDWAGRLTPPRTLLPAPVTRYSFKQGVPALDTFPLALWRRCQASIGQEISAELYGYGSPRGYAPLREAIQGYLGRSRMLRVSPEQIVITSGTQHALDLVARLFLNPGDRVIFEDPSYLSARQVMLAAGAQLIPVQTDGDGLRTDQLRAIGRDARLMYVTPSHQFPTGGVLPLHRRQALLEWARHTGTLIVEDDYDSEFRYGQRPIEALAALDASLPGIRAVIYIGTFSKVLFPSMRIGYVVLPPDLVTPFLAAKEIAERHPPTIEQATLAAFMADGHFDRHLARMRRLYASRRTALLGALDRWFGPRAVRDTASTAAGLHLLVNFEVPYGESEMIARALAAGVLIEPASPFYLGSPPTSAALLGYAVMDEANIALGVRALAEALA